MFREGNLVLYKNRPCVVESSGERSEIRMPDGETARIRDKDAELLHPGPALKFKADNCPEGDFETARQMTQGLFISHAGLAELVFGASSPEIAWACAREILSGERFEGTIAEARPLSDGEMEARGRKRDERAEKESERAQFIARAGRIEPLSGDSKFTAEIESFAAGYSDKAPILKELGISQEREKAHEFLLKRGVWPVSRNPWPSRHGMPSKPVPDFPYENDDSGRIDLTSMEAWAIDNAWSNDPDDAISFHEGSVWVHIADPSSFVKPGTSVWDEARSRAVTFYNPEGTVPMLPPNILFGFSLGLGEVSRALSFKLALDPGFNVSEAEIVPSFVRITRLSYAGADAVSGTGSLGELSSLASGFMEKRKRNGSVDIEIPEIHLFVKDGVPFIEPAARAASQAMVREMMLMTGEAAAKWAFQNNVPFPFYSQDAPGEGAGAEGLAGEFAKRKLMRSGSVSSEMSAHHGLGLGLYSQVTSPLRRFADLLAHRQIRLFLAHETLLSKDDLIGEIGRAQLQSGQSRQAERNSDLHWQCVWLLSRPGWKGNAVVVGNSGRLLNVYIPEIGHETKVPADRDCALNESVTVEFKGADLPNLNARFVLA